MATAAVSAVFVSTAASSWRLRPSRSAMLGLLAAVITAQYTSQCAGQQASAPHFRAKWFDGHLDSGELTGWNDPSGSLLYRGRPVFGGGEKRVRWLLNTRTSCSESPASGIELAGGDFLAGDVIGSLSDPGDPQGSDRTLLIEPAGNFDVPGMTRRRTISIGSSRVRRIRWTSQQQFRFQPQTAFFRDGRSIHFQAIHWTGAGVRLLMDDKIQNVRFVELAELHLAAREAWQTYLDQLAELDPACDGKLVHIDAQDNVRITTSTHRLRLWSNGQNRSAAEGLIIVQPTWTTDGLAIPLDRIERITVFSPEELPLTRLTPTKSEHRGFVFDHFVAAQIDANVLGGPLRSGGAKYAWGFGVHARH